MTESAFDLTLFVTNVYKHLSMKSELPAIANWLANVRTQQFIERDSAE